MHSSHVVNLYLSQDDGNNGYTTQFWVGLLVSLFTNFVQSFAMTFQRKSHIYNDALPIEERKGPWQRPLWVSSFTTYLVANITGSIFSVGYLPIVILAPIGAMGMVFNSIAARIVLGDQFTTKSVLGTFMIAIGALMVGLFGVIPEPDHDIDDLIRLYHRPAFFIYFGILESILLVAIISTHLAEHYCKRLERRGCQSDSKILGGRLTHDKFKSCIGISYGVISGNISSQSMLFAKSGIQLIILTVVFNVNQFQHFITWFLLIMTVITAILQLYYLNKGLSLCDTVILIPMSFCSFNLFCLFNGLVYYDQWDRFQWWQLMLVMLGVVVTIVGVLILSWRSSKAIAPTSPDQVTERTPLLA